MTSNLNADQVKVLIAAWKANAYVSATFIAKGTGLKFDDVDGLYRDGFLEKNQRRFKWCERTIIALDESGIDVSQIPQEEPQKVKPKKEELAKKLDISISQASVIDSFKKRQQARFLLAKRKLIEGDPFPMLRLQWPELVIQDALEKRYFASLCERDHDLDLRLDDRQCDLIKHTFDQSVRQIGIKGSTSPGKGFATAIAANLWYTAFEDGKIILIGPSSAHSKNVMFSEIAAWRSKMKMPGPGDVLTMSIKDPRIGFEKHTLTIVNPETGEGLSGAHSPHGLFIFDEASALSEEHYINAQKQATQLIAISNPRILSGWFFDMFPRATPNDNQISSHRGVRTRLITFGGKDCINVKGKRLHVKYAPPGGIDIEDLDGNKWTFLEGAPISDDAWPHIKALIPGQMDYAKYKEIMKRPSEIERAWSGEGKFPPEDLDLQIIPPSWLEKPCQLWVKEHDTIEVLAFGLDLAASVDKDATVLAAGGPKGIKTLHKTRKANAISTLDWMRGVFNSYGIDPFQDYYPIAIDWQGAGGNVMADLMEENGAFVIRVVPQSGANDKALYMNRRAEVYAQLAGRLDPESEHLDPFMLPDDSELREELVAHEKIYAPDMTRFRLTPKKKASSGADSKYQSLREKLGRSPDSSDATTLCYDAILHTMGDSHVCDQFDPTNIVVGTQEIVRRGEVSYEVEYASGATEIVNEEPGTDASIEDYARQMEEAFENYSATGDYFGIG